MDTVCCGGIASEIKAFLTRTGAQFKMKKVLPGDPRGGNYGDFRFEASHSDFVFLKLRYFDVSRQIAMRAKEIFPDRDLATEAASKPPLSPEKWRQRAEKQRKAEAKIRELEQTKDAKIAAIRSAMVEGVASPHLRAMIMAWASEIQRASAAQVRILRMLPD